MDVELTEDEQRIARKIHIENEISGWIGFSLMLLMVSAAGILAYQGWQFLRTGEWTALHWSDAFAWAGPLDLPKGRGVEKILRWLGNLPLFMLPIALLLLCGLWFTDKGSKDDAATRMVRMKLANAEYAKSKKHPR